MLDDFNVDSGRWFPDQRLDGDPTECDGIVIADICSDIDDIQYDQDFSYAMALRIAGTAPTTAGADDLSSMMGAVAYGLLPASDARFTALTSGELYVANYRNYSGTEFQTALQHAQKGVKVLPLDFDTVISEAQVNKGVALTLNWHLSFNSPSADGTLVIDPSMASTRHRVRVVGQKTVAGQQFMVIKPLLGKGYGLGGYSLLSEPQFNACALTAHRFDPNANRFASLVGIAATRFPYLLQVVAYLFKVSPAAIQTIVDTPSGADNSSPNSSPPNVPQTSDNLQTQQSHQALQQTVGAPKYDFSTQLAAKHSIRVIADEEGLTFDDKNDLTACIRVESQYMNRYLSGPNEGQPVSHKNYSFMPNGVRVLSSTDWGIVQCNDYFHIGPGKDFASVDYVIANPADLVRWMAQLFKAGQQHLWDSHSSGAYKQYLPTAADPTVL